MTLRPDPSLFYAITHYPERLADIYARELAERCERIRDHALALAAREGAQPIPETVAPELVERHQRMTQTFWQAEGRCMSWFIVGPANFPTSANQKRQRSRDKRAEEVSAHLKAALRRLDRIAFPHGQGDAIRSADPEALNKLRAKLAEREAFQVTMKQANVVIRRYGAEAAPHLEALGLKARTVASILAPDHSGRIGFPPFTLSNNKAEISRLTFRIVQLERTRERGTVEREAPAGIRVVENAEAARVQLVFPDKPDPETRTLLKANGFRWAPSEGAWQRHLNNAGRWAAERVLAQLNTAGAA